MVPGAQIMRKSNGGEISIGDSLPHLCFIQNRAELLDSKSLRVATINKE